MENTDILMTSKSKIVVNDFSTFEEWTESLKKFRSVNTMNSVVFDLSELSFHENVSLTTRVDYYNSSKYGRKTQGCFMTLAVLAIFIDAFISLVSGELFSAGLGYQLLIDFGIVVFSALTGKVTGLIYAHVSLLKLAQRIRKRLVCAYVVKHSM